MTAKQALDYLYECIFGKKDTENERKKCIFMDAFDEILKENMGSLTMSEVLEKIPKDPNNARGINEELADEAELAKLKEFVAKLELSDKLHNDYAESIKEQFFGTYGFFGGLSP